MPTPEKILLFAEVILLHLQPVGEVIFYGVQVKIPKALFGIGGETLLLRQFRLLRDHGISDITVMIDALFISLDPLPQCDETPN